jgi:hypothetical protein
LAGKTKPSVFDPSKEGFQASPIFVGVARVAVVRMSILKPRTNFN